jgi:5'-methylthioadenosine phosphorylase
VALRVGLIGGTGLYKVADAEPIDLETPAGDVTLWRTRMGSKEVFFLPRHGPSHEHVPLRVPHAAHIHALRSARCDYVIGVNNVGSLKRELRPGTWFVPDDFVDLHRSLRPTLYADAPVHVDFTTPYCPHIRQALLRHTEAKEGTYVGVDGPRFETRAEVRWMSGLGDVVGMTGVPEAVLAHEDGLCYASLCFVGNHATGLGGRVRASQIQEGLGRRRAALLKLLEASIRALPAKKGCRCQELPRSLTSSKGSRP